MIKLKTEVAVGMMAMGGLVLIAFLVFGISGIYAFRPGYQLNAMFNYVGIIDQGAPVRYAGVKIGEVKKVTILEGKESGKANVLVTFFVVNGAKVYEHDKISVQGTHIMAEPHVAIEPVVNGGRPLKDGETVQGVDPVELDELIIQGKEIAEKINHFLTQMQTSVGDPAAQTALKDSLVNMAQLLQSLNKIMQGKEEDVRAGLSSLTKSADQLSAVLEKVNKGQGTMGKVITDDALSNDLREFTSEIKQHPWRLFKK